MTAKSLPQYSVQELNAAIGNLLERGFAPRFLLEATISKSQLKKGHLWLTLSDGNATITAVIWSSTLKNLSFQPVENDGVLIVGKLNFWQARASLAIQVLDIRPSISTVFRKFEAARLMLLKEGLLDESLRRKLPTYPTSIAILTSVPSSALADILRTSKDRWPLAKLFVIPISVQGGVSNQIQLVLSKIVSSYKKLNIQAVVLARGGGSREDLMVFDDLDLCRALAQLPIPLVTGIGHEDDLTVADLVADYRAATPTAAMVALLPTREVEIGQCFQKKQRLIADYSSLVSKYSAALLDKKTTLASYRPFLLIQKYRERLHQKYRFLEALSPNRWLSRGFAIVRDEYGHAIQSTDQVVLKQRINIQLSDGNIGSVVETIEEGR